MRAWRALPAFRGDSSARTWLLAIARRACADSIRGAVRRRRLARQVEQRHADAGGDDRRPDRRARSLQALVDGLDRDQRVAFVLTQVVGCSYAEAADDLRRAGRHDPVARRACARAAARARSATPRPGERDAWRSPSRAARCSRSALVGARHRDRRHQPASAHGVGGIAAHELPDEAAPRAAPTSPAITLTVVDLGGKLAAAPTPRRRTWSCSGTTTSRTCASARAACSRTHAHRRPTSTGRRSPTGSRAEVGRPHRRAACGSRCRRADRALARPPRALHGHLGCRRSCSATATTGSCSTTGRSRCAHDGRDRHRDGRDRCGCRRRRRGRS